MMDLEEGQQHTDGGPPHIKRWDLGSWDEHGDYACLVCGETWTSVNRDVPRNHVRRSHGVAAPRLERIVKPNRKERRRLSEEERSERAKETVKRYKQVGICLSVRRFPVSKHA